MKTKALGVIASVCGCRLTQSTGKGARAPRCSCPSISDKTPINPYLESQSMTKMEDDCMFIHEKVRKGILVFLCADVLFSVALLCFAIVSRTQANVVSGKTERIAEVENKAQEEKPSAQNKKVANVDRQIEEAEQAVNDEMNRQQEAASQSKALSFAQKQWVTLEELKELSEPAYNQLLQQLEYERKKCEKSLEQRRTMIAEMQHGILTDEEEKELLELLDFLNTCDENTINGVPIPDRTAEYPVERKNKLKKIIEKYCEQASGYTKDASRMYHAFQNGFSHNDRYVPFVPRNYLNELKLQ